MKFLLPLLILIFLLVCDKSKSDIERANERDHTVLFKSVAVVGCSDRVRALDVFDGEKLTSIEWTGGSKQPSCRAWVAVKYWDIDTIKIAGYANLYTYTAAKKGDARP